MKTLTYITLLLAIIALILSGMAFAQTSDNINLETRLDTVENYLTALGDRVEGEAQESLNRAETELILLKAKNKLLQSKIEAEINHDYEEAVTEVEDAQEELARAHQTANETLQSQINELNDELDMLRREMESEAENAVDTLQAILDQWEKQLSG